MLTIMVESVELYNPKKEEFINTVPGKLVLEHSLVSISKWESKWKKPFMGKESKTMQETLDYIRCMTINTQTDDSIYNLLTSRDIEAISEYIDDEMTATTITQSNGKPNRETITSELIYYWMVTLNIPFECQKWHLNRLITLITVCNVKNQPTKKRSKRDLAEHHRQVNAERRAKAAKK